MQLSRRGSVQVYGDSIRKELFLTAGSAAARNGGATVSPSGGRAGQRCIV